MNLVTIEWNEENHRIYNIDGFNVPSVTTVCNVVPSKWVEKWKARTKHSTEISNLLSTAGTIVHYKGANILAELWDLPRIPIDFGPSNVKTVKKYYINDEKFPVTQYRDGLLSIVDKCVEAFTYWVEEYNPKPPIHEIGARKGRTLSIHPCEKVVFHKRLYYAGTADLLCSINGENWLVDLKSNDHSSARYDLQLSGYRACLLDMLPTTKFKNIAILNLRLSHEIMSRVSDNFVTYRFSPKIIQDRLWMMLLGGFYYENRHDPIVGSNAPKVFWYLKKRKIPIVKNIASNDRWQDQVGQF